MFFSAKSHILHGDTGRKSGGPLHKDCLLANTVQGTLGWQLVGVVVGQLQSRCVFGRKDNVTAHGYRISCEDMSNIGTCRL